MNWWNFILPQREKCHNRHLDSDSALVISLMLLVSNRLAWL